jgi:hypothetical protein
MVTEFQVSPRFISCYRSLLDLTLPDKQPQVHNNDDKPKAFHEHHCRPSTRDS